MSKKIEIQQTPNGAKSIPAAVSNDDLLDALGLKAVSVRGRKVILRGEEEVTQLLGKEYRPWLIKSYLASLNESSQPSEYKRVIDLIYKTHKQLKIDTWLPIQNGFDVSVTRRGSYTMRRKVKIGGVEKHELYSLTPKGGLKSIGYRQISDE